MKRWLLTIGTVLALVTVGGNCRRMLAQSPPRKTPMTAAEWAEAYDRCVAGLGTPVVLASRTPLVSAGVGCIDVDGQ